MEHVKSQGQRSPNFGLIKVLFVIHTLSKEYSVVIRYGK